MVFVTGICLSKVFMIFKGRSLNIGLFDISFNFNEMSYLVILFETGNE